MLSMSACLNSPRNLIVRCRFFGSTHFTALGVEDFNSDSNSLIWDKLVSEILQAKKVRNVADFMTPVYK